MEKVPNFRTLNCRFHISDPSRSLRLRQLFLLLLFLSVSVTPW